MHFFAFCSVLFLLNYSIAFAQNPGAYSSPHYNKKAYYNQKYQQSLTDTFYQKIPHPDVQKTEQNDRSKHQEIDISQYSNSQIELAHSNLNQTSNNINNVVSPQNNIVNNVNQYDYQNGRSTGGFMESAGQFLNGRGGQMLADIARELISRSTGASSQVLSLNLTNLVILVILKALILAAGMFGAGAWTHGYARSIDDSSNSQLISGPELDLWMSYLQGRPECLQLASCKNPKLAKKYSGGADLLLTVAKFTNGIVPYDVRYEKIVDHIKEATIWGSANMPCEERFKCMQAK